MALVGRGLGKEVGEWFGPSTAAGAIKTLANGFPPCGLAVTTAIDGVVYDSDVYEASSKRSEAWDQVTAGLPLHKPFSRGGGNWGGTAVLVLAGIRLGVDGVNPVYHECIKVSPDSVLFSSYSSFLKSPGKC